MNTQKSRFLFFFSAKGSLKLEDKGGALPSHSVGSVLGWTTFKLCLGFLILHGRCSPAYATWLLSGLRKAIYRAHRKVPDARNGLISGGYWRWWNERYRNCKSPQGSEALEVWEMLYITVTRGPIYILCSGLCIFSSLLPHPHLSGSFYISHLDLQVLPISFPERRHSFPLTSVALSIPLRVPLFLFNISFLWADTTKSYRAFLPTQLFEGSSVILLMLHIYKSGPEKLHGLTGFKFGTWKIWTMGKILDFQFP